MYFGSMTCDRCLSLPSALPIAACSARRQVNTGQASRRRLLTPHVRRWGPGKGVSPTSIAVVTAACGQVAKAAHARRGRRLWSRGHGWSDAGSDGDGLWRGLRTLCRPKLLIARRRFDHFPSLVWSLASGMGYISEQIALQMQTVPPKSLPRGWRPPGVRAARASR